jgi:hypothetical protein
MVWSVVAAGLIALAIGATIVLYFGPPRMPLTGAVWFCPTGHRGVRYRVSDLQAKTLRSILVSHGRYQRTGDSEHPLGFFYVDERCFYWRGTALALNPERGSHWVWQGSPYLEQMYAWSLRNGGFNDEGGVRAFLHLLDPEPAAALQQGPTVPEAVR